jgi:beta-lactamase class A
MASELKKEEIEKRVLDFVEEKREEGILTPNHRTAWLVYGLEDSRNLVSLNTSELFQCASMVKPFFALAFFHEVDKGRLEYDVKASVKMEEMLRPSDNNSAKWIVDKLGGSQRMEKLLRENYPRIFTRTLIKQDPVEDGRYYDNKSCADDYAEFLRSLWACRLPNSAEIKRLMSLRKRNCIASDVDVIPEDTPALNKTGSNGYFSGDMGIISADFAGIKYPYILIGLMQREEKVEDDVWYEWLGTQRNVIRGVSGIIYKYLQERIK